MSKKITGKPKRMIETSTEKSDTSLRWTSEYQPAVAADPHQVKEEMEETTAIGTQGTHPVVATPATLAEELEVVATSIDMIVKVQGSTTHRTKPILRRGTHPTIIQQITDHRTTIAGHHSGTTATRSTRLNKKGQVFLEMLG